MTADLNVAVKRPKGTHGGKRANAGRKKTQGKRRAPPHRARRELSPEHPVHVVLRATLRRDARRSRAYARRGAAIGDSGALFELATQLDSSEHRAEVREARRIYLRLARLGHTTAMFNLGVSYRQLGEHRRALGWFRKAASGGDGSAQIEVAKAEYLGVGTRRRAPEALRQLLSIVAEERLDISPYEREQCFIWAASALLDGWCIPRDHPQARSYLRTAAALGSLTARAMLEELC